jgi:hypothetical protein
VIPKLCCCKQLEFAIGESDIPIDYVAKFREAGVRVMDGGTSKITFVFCPWCGCRLPASLRDAWFEELSKRGIDPAVDEIPPEFSDDRWFRDERRP